MEIRHEPANRRFVVTINGSEAELTYTRVDDATLDYRHTFVPPALRGQGIASELTERALQFALEERLSVVPSCPFVAAFIRRHSQYQSLVA